MKGITHPYSMIEFAGSSKFVEKISACSSRDKQNILKGFKQKLTYNLIQTLALLLASIKSDKFSEVTTLWSPKALRCLSALPIDVVAANQATLVVTSRLYCN